MGCCDYHVAKTYEAGTKTFYINDTMENVQQWWDKPMQEACKLHGEEKIAQAVRVIDETIKEASQRGEAKAWRELVDIIEQSENPFPKEMLRPEGCYYSIFENFRSIVLHQVDKKRREIRLAELKK